MPHTSKNTRSWGCSCQQIDGSYTFKKLPHSSRWVSPAGECFLNGEKVSIIGLDVPFCSNGLSYLTRVQGDGDADSQTAPPHSMTCSNHFDWLVATGIVFRMENRRVIFVKLFHFCKWLYSPHTCAGRRRCWLSNSISTLIRLNNQPRLDRWWVIHSFLQMILLSIYSFHFLMIGLIVPPESCCVLIRPAVMWTVFGNVFISPWFVCCHAVPVGCFKCTFYTKSAIQLQVS